MGSIPADPVQPSHEAATEGATGNAVFPGVSAYSLLQSKAKKDEGVAARPKSAKPLPIDEARTERAKGKAASFTAEALKALLPIFSGPAEKRPCKRMKRDTALDMDEVLYAGRSGPTRRTTEVLPVQPAFECTSEELMRGILRVVQAGLELTDEHMDHSSFLMKKQHPLVDGLQRMAVFESRQCQRVGTPQGKFVQVLLVGSHWVTVSNVFCENAGEIMVYDSFYSQVPASYKSTFVAKICWMLHTPALHVTLMWPAVTKQMGNKDCGLFALANAVALCEGVRPEECEWDQPRLRSHLISCFKRGQMSHFPHRAAMCDRGLVHQESIEIFCHCRQPDSGKMMVECESCAFWFHKQCEKLPNKLPDSYKFICRNCRQ